MDVPASRVDAALISEASVPRVREAKLADYAAVSHLLRDNGLEPKSLEEWCHRYEHNPALKDFEHGPPIGWVLEVAASENRPAEVVGFIGNVPAVYELQGKKIRAVIACDWAVAKQYRAASLSLLARYFVQTDVDLFVTTTARRNSGPSFLYFQAMRVPVDSYNVAYFAITHHEFITSFLRKKNIPAPAVLSWSLSLGLQGVDFFKGLVRQSGPMAEEIKILTHFDERFDVFWNRLRRQKSGTLLATRSARQLAWHFHAALEKHEVWILVYEQNAQIMGYAIYFRQDNAALNLKRMRLADLQFLDGDIGIANALLAAGLKMCRGADIHMLEILGFNAEKRSLFEAFGFRCRKLEAWPFFYKPTNADLKAILAQGRRWDPCLFDGDGCL